MPAEPQPLNARTLKYWTSRVPVPAYDRTLVTPGVVHIGVGGFHRAHQAMYHDRLLSEGALDWGICGVGVMAADRRMKQVLDAQDGLYTLVLKHSDGTYEPRVIGSIVEYLYAPDDPEAVIEKMAAGSTRIVSLTITEGGYNVSDVTGEFDLTNPGVIGDLEPGAVPRTTFGLITEALRRRWIRGLAPFTVMSCDNLQDNGYLSKRVFTAFARLRDPALWKDDQPRPGPERIERPAERRRVDGLAAQRDRQWSVGSHHPRDNRHVPQLFHGQHGRFALKHKREDDRIEPADVDVCPDAEVGVVEPQVGHVFVLGVDVTRSPGRDGRRP